MEQMALLPDSDRMDDEEEDAHVRAHDTHPLAKVLEKLL
jgi:hypothetical protein